MWILVYEGPPCMETTQPSNIKADSEHQLTKGVFRISDKTPCCACRRPLSQQFSVMLWISLRGGGSTVGRVGLFKGLTNGRGTSFQCPATPNNWVAVKQLISIYSCKETLVLTIYPYDGQIAQDP